MTGPQWGKSFAGPSIIYWGTYTAQNSSVVSLGLAVFETLGQCTYVYIHCFSSLCIFGCTGCKPVKCTKWGPGNLYTQLGGFNSGLVLVWKTVSNQTVGSVTECICCHWWQQLPPRIQAEGQKCISRINPHFFTPCLDTEVVDVALLSMADVRAETVARPIPSW